jgi:hypothetical protein
MHVFPPGTASDRAVGLRLGQSGSAIKFKGEQQGIAPFRVLRWSEDELSWLGVDTDRAIARSLAGSRSGK